MSQLVDQRDRHDGDQHQCQILDVQDPGQPKGELGAIREGDGEGQTNHHGRCDDEAWSEQTLYQRMQTLQEMLGIRQSQLCIPEVANRTLDRRAGTAPTNIDQQAQLEEFRREGTEDRLSDENLLLLARSPSQLLEAGAPVEAMDQVVLERLDAEESLPLGVFDDVVRLATLVDLANLEVVSEGELPPGVAG